MASGHSIHHYILFFFFAVYNVYLLIKSKSARGGEQLILMKSGMELDPGSEMLSR